MWVRINKQEIELPEGSSAKDLAEKLNLRNPDQSLAAKINGVDARSLHPLKEGDQVELIHFEDPQGKEVFWHTSAHVLAQAILRLYPDAKPTIGPPIENGFYYDFANLTISEEDFEKIEKEVQKIIDENYTTKRHVLKEKRKQSPQIQSPIPLQIELIEGFDEGRDLRLFSRRIL